MIAAGGRRNAVGMCAASGLGRADRSGMPAAQTANPSRPLPTVTVSSLVQA